eukprot:7402332-Karenia_brevis.AAC.1
METCFNTKRPQRICISESRRLRLFCSNETYKDIKQRQVELETCKLWISQLMGIIPQFLVPQAGARP